MAKHPIAVIVKRLRTSFQQKVAGFTLTELLVSIIIGAFITLLLLQIVVELTTRNQRDAARSQVQRDMQAALDYIAQDVREAVFVYDGQCLEGTTGGAPLQVANFNDNCPGIAGYIPETLSNADRTPVLAFWRTDPLPSDITGLCRANAGDLRPMDNEGVPCIAGYSYSLIVYVIDKSDPNDFWKGKARLRRYQLSQFARDASAANAQTRGYVNPLREPSDSFLKWPYRLTGGGVINRQQTAETLTQEQTDRGVQTIEGTGRPQDAGLANSPVLVDFVDTTTPASGAQPLRCLDFVSSSSPPDNPYEVSPRNGTNLPRGLYACVRGGGIASRSTGVGGRVVGLNQEVLLVLTGSVFGQPGFTDVKDNLNPIQTRVLVRGVINKQ